jgi:hypothetical protein
MFKIVKGRDCLTLTGEISIALAGVLCHNTGAFARCPRIVKTPLYFG